MKTMLEKFKALMIRMSGYLMLAFAGAPMATVLAEGEGAQGNTGGVLDYSIENGTIQGAKANLKEGFAGMQKTGNTIYRGVVAIALIIVMVIFIVKLTKLAKSGDNPSERQKAIDSIITLLVAVALIGGAATITSWVWNALSGF